jgi:ABC-type transport system involved in cytochrome bd biosynthesis fused ATPase/permease subunit
LPGIDAIRETRVKSLRVGLWGSGVEMTHVEILASRQRAIAQGAEALREKRARLIKAQAELEAAGQSHRAREIIMQNWAGRRRRRMQMITEVGAEQTGLTIVMMTSAFVALTRGIRGFVKR